MATSVFCSPCRVEDPMNYRMPDFDLRPRRVATSPTPMRSSFDVDDEDDDLGALVTAALAPWNQRDARHTALEALPSSLCQPTTGVVWPVQPTPRRAAKRRAEPMMIGTMLSAAIALLMLAAAMLWRLEAPRVVHLEGATPAVHVADHPALDPNVDAISSASRR